MSIQVVEAKSKELRELVLSNGVDSEGQPILGVEASLVTARLIERLIIKNPQFLEELQDELDSMRFYRSN